MNSQGQGDSSTHWDTGFAHRSSRARQHTGRRPLALLGTTPKHKQSQGIGGSGHSVSSDYLSVTEKHMEISYALYSAVSLRVLNSRNHFRARNEENKSHGLM